MSMIIVRHANLAGHATHTQRPPFEGKAGRTDVPGPFVEGESMADTSMKNLLFKRTMPARDKAETTTSISRSIAEAEVAAREAKTARLRRLRLAKEAADEEARIATAAAAVKPAKAKARNGR